MKLRTTFILLVIAIVLGAFILVLDHQFLTTREQTDRTQRVFEVERKEIKGFTIHNGDNLVKVKTEGDSWKLTKPWTDNADLRVVDQLLNTIQFLRPDNVIDNLGKGDIKRDKMKEFGLHRSRLSLKLDGKHTPGEIQFGGDTAIPGKCYLRIGDEDVVYVVSNDLRNIVSKKAEDFRDHRLTPFLTTLITRAIIQMRGGEIELEKQQDNWQLVRPIKARANNDVVTNLLTKVNQTQIAKFVPRDKANVPMTGLDSPSSGLTLFTGTDEKIEIQFGSIDPTDNQKMFAFLPERDAVIEINKAFAGLFDITPNELRDRKIARINQDLVDCVTIEKVDQPKIILARQENRWKFVAPNNSVANANSINRLLEAINSGEINEFVSDTATDLGKYGLDKPFLQFTCSSYSSENTAESNAGESVLATVTFGKSENGLTYERIAEEPFIFSVPDTLISELPSTEFDFRTLEITDLKRSDLIRVHIEHLGAPPLDLVRDNKNKWVLKGSKNQQNATQIQLLLNTVCGLRAASWVGDLKPEYGLETPSLILVAVYQAEGKPREIILKFGAANPNNQHYGSVSSIRGAFLINNSAFSQLDTPLRD